MSKSTTCLVGCGILKKEVRYLIEKNHWPLKTDFLPPSLHIDYNRLACALQHGLARHLNESTLVFYGECHPGMDKMLQEAHTRRVQGQNCIEMLLGTEEFERELTNGAFFLLEDWVHNFDEVIVETFGDNIEVTREIFHERHRYLLCLRTPQSADYLAEAEHIGQMLELPLVWRDVGLEHLESVIRNAIGQYSETSYV